MLTSPSNDRVRYVRALNRKKRDRYSEQRFVLEGLRLVREALSSEHRPAFVFYTDSFAQSERGAALLADMDAVGVERWEVTEQILRDLSDTVTPQGVLAVAPMPEPDPAVVRRATLVLVLDALADPGNMGTILRTAEAARVDAVILSEGCTDPFAPKVVRSAMGAHLRLPMLVNVSWDAMPSLLEGKRVLLADADGERAHWEADWVAPVALIVGSEAHGPGPQATALAQETVRLPMAPVVESLNAAIATAVLLFEAQRQRILAGR